MGTRKTMCVIGSVNTDIHASMERFPLAGETLCARSLQISGGGKGANQAVALARLGAPTILVAKLGADAFGRARLDELRAAGVDVSAVGIETGVESGSAIVETDGQGQNRIAIIAGANALVDGAFIESCAKAIGGSELALFQLEVPVEAVQRGLEIAKGGGVITILDPAPARPLPAALYPLVDYITPNETETAALVGILPEDEGTARRAAAALASLGTACVIIKAGDRGAFLFRASGTALFCPAFPVRAIDSTAAGDAFNAGFAWELGSSGDEARALRFACAVGALATTKQGAQAAMPSLEETLSLLAAHPGIATRPVGGPSS